MKPGTVVICNYINFTGESKRGLFIVLSDEGHDNSNFGCMNFTAIKITTQLSMVGNYAVNLDVEENPFFNNPCLASCSKIHTLHKNQIQRVLGKLSNGSFKKVYITVHNFLEQVNKQMMSEL